MITLYIWQSKHGGTSIWWMGPGVPKLSHGFFYFGKYSGGWLPMTSVTHNREYLERRAEGSVQQIKERFDLPAKVVWGPPPDEELEALHSCE